ncbi:MAG: hypothetical protein RIC55_13340 [Pirellulaceae bacterium]
MSHELHRDFPNHGLREITLVGCSATTVYWFDDAGFSRLFIATGFSRWI